MFLQYLQASFVLVLFLFLFLFFLSERSLPRLRFCSPSLPLFGLIGRSLRLFFAFYAQIFFAFYAQMVVHQVLGFELLKVLFVLNESPRIGIDSQPSFVPQVCRLPNVSSLVRSAGTGAAMKVVVRRSSSALEGTRDKI